MKRNLIGAGLIVWVAAIALIVTCPLIMAQQPDQSTAGQQVDKSSSMTVSAGQEMKLDGLIAERTSDGFLLSTGQASKCRRGSDKSDQDKGKKEQPVPGGQKLRCERFAPRTECRGEGTRQQFGRAGRGRDRAEN